ncbi:uncharacterized protein LOC111324099 [Stylophora pistillata]|uniref:uncharacterized protein LOC111324099 n=1 Tax=Stylophora pistillata TaxID=50429 RepID=UPI000C0519DB|nr:uncharacterized protein LOC111324099 [Stylophora pistillata]
MTECDTRNWIGLQLQCTYVQKTFLLAESAWIPNVVTKNIVDTSKEHSSSRWLIPPEISKVVEVEHYLKDRSQRVVKNRTKQLEFVFDGTARSLVGHSSLY